MNFGGNLLSILRSVFLLIAAISFGLGISLPLVQMERLYFFTETPSLLNVITGLWSEGNILITVVVAMFSISVSNLEITICLSRDNERAQTASMGFDAWESGSLVDVMLVAILIFAAKTSGLATAIAQPGIWFYMASAIFSALAVSKFVRP